ncbi:cyclic GMP-AMP synthase DncV-like nucleotidyltransferase [Lewinella sp. 4G2]|uniref:CBASS cGAMP synthase n=1 Tax=Lewinella sp. 4G2 TaxID=1803372 RepID=UPI0007B487DB|nr:hypothetical protein [Lewinella sp. 4G2]OAV43965.1 hypothetical protein A3850_005415 [Lewinella sp. 4G2]
MANCHKLFLTFNSDLKITTTKKRNLIKSKDSLRDRIRKWFRENRPDYVPLFWIQGSYKMKVVIRTKDDTCDLDDGIYFARKIDVSPSTMQGWIYQAVSGHTGNASQRQKCVRVDFAGNYHIDYPIYQNEDQDTAPWLCIKDGAWDDEQSDPKAYVDWFNERKTDQLARIIRYLKSWGDNVRHNMLSGLAMTLLAEDNYYQDERDDEALLQTLRNVQASLEDEWTAVMPTVPNDDVIKKHDKDFQKRFFDKLDALITDGESALEQESELKASKLWRKHLGARFPLGKAPSGSRSDSLREVADRGMFSPYFSIDLQ